MSYQLIDDEEVTEPVSLDELKSFIRIDSDYAAEDADLLITLSAARIRLEQFLNIGLVQRSVKLQWPGYPIELPLSPTGTITVVNEGVNIIAEADYSINGYQAKSIMINGSSPSNWDYFYNLIDGYVEITSSNGILTPKMYQVTYTTGYEVLPKALKFALMTEADYLYKLRGMPVTDNISPNAETMASGYNRNTII